MATDPTDAPDFDGHWGTDDDDERDEADGDLYTGNPDMVPPWAEDDEVE